MKDVEAESELGWDFLETLKRSLSLQYVVVIYEELPRLTCFHRSQNVPDGSQPEADSLEESRKRHKEALAQRRRLAHPQSPIERIACNPQLFDPIRAPRNPIVLCHGASLDFYVASTSISIEMLQGSTASMCEVLKFSRNCGCIIGRMFSIS
jgi:hypothetical protein